MDIRSNLFLLLLVVGFTSCSKRINDLIVSKTGVFEISPGRDSLQIHFLGTTCFWFSYNNSAVLTDPFISNPPLRKVMFGKVKPDSAIINAFIPTEKLNAVKAVTVGHAHYDHLLDLPYMVNLIPVSAKIIGSSTAHHIIAASNPPQEKVAANSYFATIGNAGEWIYSNDNSIRVMPVASDHPPHLMGITLYGGSYSADLEAVPGKSRKWKMGEPFAYIIDFLSADRNIAYRIWFQSSGAEYPLGFFPEEMLGEKGIDAAIFSVATDTKPESYPDKIISFLHPKVIFMAHWENFWRNKYKTPKTVQKGNPEKLYYHLDEKFGREAEVVLPHPGGKFVLR